MFVDNIGILQFGEVAEEPSRLNSKMGANEKLPSTVLVLTPQQCESLKKDRIFKLINRSKMEELFEFMQEAREMDRKIELEHATEEVRQQALEEGFIIMIKNFIKSCKEKPTAAAPCSNI